MPLLIAASAPPAGAELAVSIVGLRSAKGAIMLCLTRRAEQSFLTCDLDPARITRIIAAGEANQVELGDMLPGEYSLLVIHDENRNGKLDKMFGDPHGAAALRRRPLRRAARAQRSGDQAQIPALAGRRRRAKAARHVRHFGDAGSPKLTGLPANSLFWR